MAQVSGVQRSRRFEALTSKYAKEWLRVGIFLARRASMDRRFTYSTHFLSAKHLMELLL